MLETNFIAQMNKWFPDLITYYKFIPDNAAETAFCFENAGMGTNVIYTDGNTIQTRTIKLTLSTTDIEKLFMSQEVIKYICASSSIGDMQIISARVTNFIDNYIPELEVHERTFTIQIKFLEVI